MVSCACAWRPAKCFEHNPKSPRIHQKKTFDLLGSLKCDSLKNRSPMFFLGGYGRMLILPNKPNCFPKFTEWMCCKISCACAWGPALCLEHNSKSLDSSMEEFWLSCVHWKLILNNRKSLFFWGARLHAHPTQKAQMLFQSLLFWSPFRTLPSEPWELSFTRGDWALLPGSSGTFSVIFLLSRTRVRLGTHYDIFFQIHWSTGIKGACSKLPG